MNPYEAYMGLVKEAIAVGSPMAAAHGFKQVGVKSVLAKGVGKSAPELYRDVASEGERYMARGGHLEAVSNMNFGKGTVERARELGHAKNLTNESENAALKAIHGKMRLDQVAKSHAQYGQNFGVNPLGHQAISPQRLAPHVTERMLAR